MRFVALCEQPQDVVVGKAGHDVQGFGRSGSLRYLCNCNAGAGVRAGAGSQRQCRGNGQGRQRRRVARCDRYRDEHGHRDVAFHRDERPGGVSRDPAAAWQLHPHGGTAGLPQVRADGPQPQRRPDHRDEYRARGGHLERNGDRAQRVPGRAAGPDRSGTDDQRSRDSQPAAGLAQSVQLRAPAGERDRLREQRVRRAPHQRERLADAHELPARRQHQHREGSRRAANAPGVGSPRARGQGRDQRLRAGVRPDDRDGLQRHHAVGHQRGAGHGELPLPAQRDVGAAVLPGAARPQARHRSQRLHRHAGRAGAARQDAFLRRLRVRRSQPDHRGAGHHGDTGERGAPRHHAAGERCHPGQSIRELRVRQARSPVHAEPPAVGPVLPFQELLRVEHRRWPDHHRPRDGFHRPDGLGLGTARVDAGLVDPERTAGAVRAAAPVPHPVAECGRRSGDHGLGDCPVRRSADRRRQLGRLRFRAGHLAGDRQRDLGARPARVQGRTRSAVRR